MDAAELVNRCNIITFHRSTKFMLLMMASSSARFMLVVLLWMLTTGIFYDGPTTFQRHTSGKRACIDRHAEIAPINVPFAMCWVFLMYSSKNHGVEWVIIHFVVPTSHDLRHLMKITTTQSHPPTGRCPTNLPHNEKTLHWVIMRHIWDLISSPPVLPPDQALVHCSLTSLGLCLQDWNW